MSLFDARLGAKILSTLTYPSFELLDLLITIGKNHLRLVNVYRPPPSSKNKLTTSAFLKEFASYLEVLTSHPGNLVIVRDFNLHLDDHNDPSATKFLNLI